MVVQTDSRTVSVPAKPRAAPKTSSWQGAAGTLAASFGVALLAWGSLAQSGILNPTLFPNPMDVGRAGSHMLSDGTFWSDMGSSLQRVGVGFVLGGFSGVIVGFFTGRWKPAARTIAPFMVFLRPIPVIALVPLFTLWFGIGETSKYVMVAYAVFLNVWLYVHDGVSRIDSIYMRVGSMFDTPKLRTILMIQIPAAAPAIAAALRMGCGVAYLALVAAELGGTQSGIAYRLQVDAQFLQTDRMLVGIIVLGVLGALSDGLLALISRTAIRWEGR